MKNWKPEIDKKYLAQHMGNISQLGGVRRYELTEGMAKGVDTIEVATGTGFDFTVLPGRCMDINWARYKGVPISFQSKAELTAGAYSKENGMEWLRDFHAGLLTTCGFSNLGGPCVEDQAVYGPRPLCIHGRLPHTPATEVGCKGEWIDGEYVMTVSGMVRQSSHAGENLTLRREITAKLGEKKFHIRDTIENEGFTREPLMLLYHMNIGYPILGKAARLMVNAPVPGASSPLAEKELDQRFIFDEPSHMYEERCYYYRPVDRGDGYVSVAVVNDDLELGTMISFDKDTLKCLTQWKLLSEGDYGLGIEPCNAYPLSQTLIKERGELEYIEPGEIKKTHVIFEILDGKEEIAVAEKLILK